MPFPFSAPLLALAVASGAVVPVVELQLDVTELPPMPARQLQGMVAEATAIWKAHGVALTWLSARGEPAPLGARVVKIVDRSAASRASSPLRLGAIQFQEGSVSPESTLALTVESI